MGFGCMWKWWLEDSHWAMKPYKLSQMKLSGIVANCGAMSTWWQHDKHGTYTDQARGVETTVEKYQPTQTCDNIRRTRWVCRCRCYTPLKYPEGWMYCQILSAIAVHYISGTRDLPGRKRITISSVLQEEAHFRGDDDVQKHLDTEWRQYQDPILILQRKLAISQGRTPKTKTHRALV